MTPLDLVARWLQSRGAEVMPARAGTRARLQPDDPLAAILGMEFLLVPDADPVTAGPGTEPVFPGSRITDLLAGDLDGVRGIAVIRAQPADTGRVPLFVFAFHAVLTTDLRRERLVRVTLDRGGAETALPQDNDPPLQPAGDGRAWRGEVARLLTVARERAVLMLAPEIERETRAAQVRLYHTARRLALYHGARRRALDGDDPAQADFHRQLDDEVERHRLRVTLTQVGVTVHL